MNQVNQVIYKELKRIAQAQSVTNYTTIGNMVGLNMENPAHRNEIASILDEINYYEHQHGRPMLSAVVIRQDINIPGEGFFECARQLGRYQGNNEQVFWVHELVRVHNYWQE